MNCTRPGGSKKLLLAAWLLPCLVACSRAMGPEELASQYVEDLVAGQRWEQWDAIMAPDARVNGNALARPYAEGTAEGLHRAFPDLAVSVRERLIDGDSAVLTFEFEGTHEGAFGQLGPTGRAVRIPGVVVVRARDGRITEVTQLMDYWHAVEQITAPSVASR
jgi:predicted ester cyclase